MFWIIVALVVVAGTAFFWWQGGRAAPQGRLDAAARRQRADGVADSTYQGVKPKGAPPAA